MMEFIFGEEYYLLPYLLAVLILMITCSLFFVGVFLHVRNNKTKQYRLGDEALWIAGYDLYGFIRINYKDGYFRRVGKINVDKLTQVIIRKRLITDAKDYKQELPTYYFSYVFESIGGRHLGEETYLKHITNREDVEPYIDLLKQFVPHLEVIDDSQEDYNKRGVKLGISSILGKLLSKDK